MNSSPWILQQRQRQRVGSGPPPPLFHAISRRSPRVLAQPHLVPGPPGKAPANNQPSLRQPPSRQPAGPASAAPPASRAPPCGAPPLTHQIRPDVLTTRPPECSGQHDFYMYHSAMSACLPNCKHCEVRTLSTFLLYSRCPAVSRCLTAGKP